MSVYVTDLDPKELKTYEQPKFDFIFFQNFTNTKKTFILIFLYLKARNKITNICAPMFITFLKLAVSRDFLAFFFFMNRIHLGPC